MVRVEHMHSIVRMAEVVTTAGRRNSSAPTVTLVSFTHAVADVQLENLRHIGREPA